MRTLRTALFAAALAVLTPGAARADKPAGLATIEAPRGERSEASIEERKSAARALALEGFDLLQSGKYQRAIQLFIEAEKKYHAPTIVLLMAEAHEKLGKLVEARSFYARIASEELPRSSPPEFYDAQRQAKSQMEALDKRLPMLQVLVPGAERDRIRVTVDGERVSPFDQPHAQNPGRHVVAVSFDDGSPVKQEIALREGAVERVVVPRSAVEAGSKRLVIPATIAFGVGVSALAVGSVAGIVAMNETPEPGVAGSSSKWSTISTVALVTAGVGLGASAVLLYLDRPSSDTGPAIGARVTNARVAIGPGSIALAGSF
jgi:hypothetical protein